MVVTTVSAPTKVVALPSIGNSYPSGPAPTAAPPVGGSVKVTLQVPEQWKNGRFGTPHTLQVPPGFSVSLYSSLPSAPRFGTISPDGLLFVSLMGAGQIVILRDNGSGTAQAPLIFAEGLNGPHGLAFHEDQGQIYLYVAENNRVSRFPYKKGQARADKRETIVANLPSGGGHSTRTIAFGPDGKMYIAAGSSCNVCEEQDPRRAAITQYSAMGTGERVFARGLRNEVGLAFHPDTGELWGTENGRDNLGNDLPPDEINIIRDGGNYGWPYCFSNQVYDTDFGRKEAAYCKTTIPPALPMQAHSAPLGITFYTAQQFPSDYRGDAFVAFHGSWNRAPKTGYKVVQLQVENGRPVRYNDFVTGWLDDSTQREWGRPVDVIVAPDGSLFITDDSANAVYRVTYSK
ncbi:MAG: sorbosone dehydrogenase family protein [Chloroflexi bacterium]|nr:sorbosone dehydrogenase family protein [Chloroflexota bacterium]